ncbi:hypothetical protein NMG60_11004979 [Bertholletia excelsa]
MNESDESHRSDSMDPLNGLSGLCLFPRTFRGSTNAPRPNLSDDLESTHGFMKSMTMRSPSKHLDQAKAILNGNLELRNSNFASFLASENRIVAIATKDRQNADVRRPALGRKKARFSLKPSSSQPSVSVEPSLDIDQLEDPEEYFLAHEKLENAKKELQRQGLGSITDTANCHLPKTERRRRPGILGKLVSYKHYSSILPESDDTFMSSQETLGQDILSPSNNISQQETADFDVELDEKELIGSTSETEKKVGELLDQLLSESCENLDENGAVSLLQEHLKIKPLDLGRLHLPDIHDAGKNDFMDLGVKLPRRRSALSDIHNLVKVMSGKTPSKSELAADSPVQSPASPTPPKSPFASISLFKKNILKSIPRSDPFPVLDVTPPRKSSLLQDEHSYNHNTGNELRASGDLISPVTEASGIRVDETNSQKIITADSIPPSEQSVNENSSGLGIGINVGLSESDGDMIKNIGIENIDGKDSASEIDSDIQADGANEMEENDGRLNINTSNCTDGPNAMEENAGDMPQEATPSGDMNYGDSSRPQTDGLHEVEKDVEDELQNTEPDADVNNLATRKSVGDKSQLGDAAVEPKTVDGSSETADVIPEKLNNEQEASRASLNEQRKTKRPPLNGQKRKTVSHRQSLAAGAGTYWESGLRRSKRIRMRPLEYWKGERFLYGRIHQSMTTVIGVKYISPRKVDGGPSMKVKSYVSDDYKELVELAALH